MDIDRLISFVHENKCLWDIREKNYHTRDIARAMWQKIAAEMDLPVITLKTKWRGLRDTFRKELKRSGEKSSWVYFKNMMFLKEQFFLRKVRNEDPETEIIARASEDEPNSTEDEPPEKRSHPRKNFTSPPTKRRRTSKPNSIERIVEIGQNKLEEFKRNESDSDYQFLVSLLPYLKKIPLDRKIFVRTKLQQVFCDEEMFRLQRPYPEVSVSQQIPTSKSSPGGWSDQSWDCISNAPSLQVMTTPSEASAADILAKDIKPQP